ncbi:MAG: hypothetical protein CVV37_00705 [Nitrospira bacterium HGW-Nitrospira-1]|nr:MAG: hypothetical protein CVV37_00705 [Nitrospira bacterium HGW-Nitrospira-1]
MIFKRSEGSFFDLTKNWSPIFFRNFGYCPAELLCYIAADSKLYLAKAFVILFVAVSKQVMLITSGI